jgi:hypothetical protein
VKKLGSALKVFRDKDFGDAGRNLDQRVTNDKKEYSNLNMAKITLEKIHERNNHAKKNRKHATVMAKEAQALQ